MIGSIQKKKKILVVDDEKNYRFVLSRIFEGAGYQGMLADSAESAMGILQKENVSLILTDLRMAHMNGLGFCQKVRCEIGEIPTLVFTADASSLGRDEMSSAGVLSCLDKPFDNQVILDLVADILLHRPETLCVAPSGRVEQPFINKDVSQKEPVTS